MTCGSRAGQRLGCRSVRSMTAPDAEARLQNLRADGTSKVAPH